MSGATLRLLLYCVCPSDESKMRAAQGLYAGFERVALKGGWQE
jgi:hypothetical protein